MFIKTVTDSLRDSDTAAKVRRAVIRLWVGRPTVSFRDASMLRKMDAVVYEAVQIMLRRRWHQHRRYRIARREVSLTRGVPTLEGERWVTLAMARILPLLAEFVERGYREGSEL